MHFTQELSSQSQFKCYTITDQYESELCESNKLQLFSVCVNALNLALMDAGIPTRAQIGAITCALTKDDYLILDPNSTEEKVHILQVKQMSAQYLLHSEHD